MNRSDQISQFIDNKILPSRIIPSIMFFSFGAILFYWFINDKKIEGVLALILSTICYFSLGIGLYGIFTWIGKYILRLIVFIARLILKGQIELIIAKNKISYKLHFK